MSESITDRVRDTLNQARRMPHGPAQVAMGEEAVRLADSANDDEWSFRAREKLVEFATFSGKPEVALVAFTWLLGQCDRDPERFSDRNLLWQYKWVAARLSEFPQISRAQMAATLEDMSARYLKHQHNLTPVHKIRMVHAIDTGDRAVAAEFFQKWKDAPYDWGQDCRACNRNSRVSYYVFAGDYEAALTEAEPLLSKRETCAEVPHSTYGKVLIPLLKLGRLDEAAQYHRAGYAMVRGNPEFMSTVGAHIAYLAAIRERHKAVELFVRHARWPFTAGGPLDQFEFFLGPRLLFDVLADTARKPTRKMNLPREFPLYREDGEYEIAAVRDWLDAKVAELAAAFDARDGNQFYAEKIAKNRALKALELPAPAPKSSPESTPNAE